MKKKVFDEFSEWGSGFKLEAERCYDKRGQPLYYHLNVYGLYYEVGYELMGYNLEKLMLKAIKDGRDNLKKYTIS